MNSISIIKNFNTEIVADTGDIDLIKQYKPSDVTTNPSLILSVSQDPKYKYLLNSPDLEQVLVNFGSEIIKEIPGYISTEVDPNYSYNSDKTIEIARKIINLYQKKGIPKERVLIKIATTWEGIKAAEILEKEGIQCNMTLIFSLVQAVACAQANVTLISPFVGRITDWYKNKGQVEEDMGVKSVKEIYNYYKYNDYKTIIMGASFRNINQIKALTGLEKLTIAPKFIEELTNNNDNTISNIKLSNVEYILPDCIDYRLFCQEMDKNEMASTKLKEGIEKFIEDTGKLINILDHFSSL